ncbi:MAG: hypothetical protein ACI358_06295 [Candidatus Limimorpha sp.]
MKKTLYILLSIAAVTVLCTSCEKQCVCKSLENGSESVIYNAYSKKDCADWEAYYDELFKEHIYECSYGFKK